MVSIRLPLVRRIRAAIHYTKLGRRQIAREIIRKRPPQPRYDFWND